MPALTDVGGCFEVTDNGGLDPSVVDELFRRTRARAFPGSCNGNIEKNENNGDGPDSVP